eukprot:5966653-Amphidinium_carterae.1
MREASSPLDVDKVCPTPVAACPKQMLLQEYLIGESTDKSTALMDYGVSPLPIRNSLVGRGAPGVGLPQQVALMPIFLQRIINKEVSGPESD